MRWKTRIRWAQHVDNSTRKIVGQLIDVCLRIQWLKEALQLPKSTYPWLYSGTTSFMVFVLFTSYLYVCPHRKGVKSGANSSVLFLKGHLDLMRGPSFFLFFFSVLIWNEPFPLLSLITPKCLTRLIFAAPFSLLCCFGNDLNVHASSQAHAIMIGHPNELFL